MHRFFRIALVTIASSAALVAGGSPTAADAAVPLPRLTVDRTATTVSGLSSGGFMANLLG